MFRPRSRSPDFGAVTSRRRRRRENTVGDGDAGGKNRAGGDRGVEILPEAVSVPIAKLWGQKPRLVFSIFAVRQVVASLLPPARPSEAAEVAEAATGWVRWAWPAAADSAAGQTSEGGRGGLLPLALWA